VTSWVAEFVCCREYLLLCFNGAQPQTAPVDLNVNWQLSHHDITDTLNGGTVGGQTTYEQLFLGMNTRTNVSAALDKIFTCDGAIRVLMLTVMLCRIAAAEPQASTSCPECPAAAESKV
jgi:hypothetical protein